QDDIEHNSVGFLPPRAPSSPRLMLFLCVLSGGNEFSRVSNILLTSTQSVESVKSVAVFFISTREILKNLYSQGRGI
ncbi:MAG TPA: hypothetical protein PLQ66_10270, partial [Anaerolineae bacterium]|nr:hypothetical protein [Anaerolineae bacterium]